MVEVYTDQCNGVAGLDRDLKIAGLGALVAGDVCSTVGRRRNKAYSTS